MLQDYLFTQGHLNTQQSTFEKESSEAVRAFFIRLISKERSIKVAFWVNNCTSLPPNLLDSFFVAVQAAYWSLQEECVDEIIRPKRRPDDGVLLGVMGSTRGGGGCPTEEGGPIISEFDLYFGVLGQTRPSTAGNLKAGAATSLRRTCK